MNLDEAIKNVSLVIRKFRGNIDGQILNAEEHIAVLESFKHIVELAKEREKELESKKDEK